MRNNPVSSFRFPVSRPADVTKQSFRNPIIVPVGRQRERKDPGHSKLETGNWKLIYCLALLLLACLGARAQAPVAITDPQQLTSKQKDDLQEFTAERLFTTRIIGGTTWSPNGRQIAFISNMSGRDNLWQVSAEGGWPVQSTASDQRQISPAWSPNGKWIAYASDQNGNEQWDVFVVSTSTGDVLNLSNTPAVSELEPAWSPDGRYLAWRAKRKDSSSYEIETFDMLFRRRRTLTSNTPKELSNLHPLWSPDGKRIAYTQVRADGNDSNVFVVDVASGKSTNLTPHTGEQTHTAAAWSPDGKTLLITSNRLNGFRNVGLLAVDTGQIQWLTEGKWDSRAGSFSPDGKFATWTTNVEGNVSIYLCNLADKKAQALALPGVNELGGSQTAFSPDGTRLLYSHNGPDIPNDVWIYTLANGKSQQITQSFMSGMRREDMVTPELVHYPSRDGKSTISAWLYMPFNQIKNGQMPAIVWIHGGPNSQWLNSFYRPVQFLANQGYLVIAPNYHGSTGYGKEFQDTNRLDMGGADLQDVAAAADWVAKSGYVDPKKIVILGGSYGGYLTLMGLTKSPDTWAAGVAIVPFVNWFTEVKAEDPLLREYDLATMGDPAKNQALWQDRSPINFAGNIKAPLLLFAGANDPRCPQEESQQIADAVRNHGGKVEIKTYEGEGHSFSRLENQIDTWKRVAGFLKFYVPAPGCGQSACEVQ